MSKTPSAQKKLAVPQQKSTDHIQVCIRVRPLNEYEKSMNVLSCLEIENKDIYLGKMNEYKKFSFDHLFGETTSQEQIYEVVGKPLAKFFIDGYNGCIFAYGQTGAGKTHTILGEHGKNSLNQLNYGLQPLILKDIFENLPFNDPEVQVMTSCSYLEIYNEKIIDLFQKINQNDKNLQIKEDLKKGIYVEGLKTKYLEDYTQVLDIINKANDRRHYAETKMNIESSRSHCIFQFSTTIKKTLNGITKTQSAKINFVDLAGSERQKDTGATGERFKESKNINKSLTMLGRVINELGEKSKKKEQQYHIPFRDSKLTYILKDSLGGNTKCVMVANITQADIFYSETLSTLKFAQRTKMIQTQTFKNEEMSGNIKILQKEIRLLRQQLVQSESTILDLQKTKIDLEKSQILNLQQQQLQNQQILEDGHSELLNTSHESESDKDRDILQLIQQINELKELLDQKEYLLELDQIKIGQLQEDVQYEKEQNQILQDQMEQNQAKTNQIYQKYQELQDQSKQLQQELEKNKAHILQQEKIFEQEKEKLIQDHSQQQTDQLDQQEEEEEENSQKEDNEAQIDQQQINSDIKEEEQQKDQIEETQQQEQEQINEIQEQKELIQGQLQENIEQQSQIDQKNLKIEQLEKENEYLQSKLQKYQNLQKKLLSGESFVNKGESFSFYKQRQKQIYNLHQDKLHKQSVQLSNIQNQKSMLKYKSSFQQPAYYQNQSMFMQKNQKNSRANTQFNFSQIQNKNSNSNSNNNVSYKPSMDIEQQQLIENPMVNSIRENMVPNTFSGGDLYTYQQLSHEQSNNVIEEDIQEDHYQSGIKNNQDNQEQQEKEQQELIDNLQIQDDIQLQNDADLGEIQYDNQEQQQIVESEAILNLMTENENLKTDQQQKIEELSDLKDEIHRFQDENDTLRETVLFVSSQLNNLRANGGNNQNGNLQQSEYGHQRTQTISFRQPNEMNQQNSGNKQLEMSNINQSCIKPVQNNNINSSSNNNNYLQYYMQSTKGQILINDFIKLQQFISGHTKTVHEDFSLYVFLPYQENNNFLDSVLQLQKKITKGNSLTDELAKKYIISGIANLNQLVEFDINLNHNKLTDQTLQNLSESIIELSSLALLSVNIMQNEQITEQGLMNFIDDMLSMQQLKEISINQNTIKLSKYQLHQKITSQQYNLEELYGINIKKTSSLQIDQIQTPVKNGQSNSINNISPYKEKYQQPSALQQNRNQTNSARKEQPANPDSKSCDMCVTF